MSIKLTFPKNKNTYVIFHDDMTVKQRNDYFDAATMDTTPGDSTKEEQEQLEEKQKKALAKAMEAVIEEIHVEVGDKLITDVNGMLNIDENDLTVALDTFLATLFLEYNRQVTESGNAIRV